MKKMSKRLLALLLSLVLCLGLCACGGEGDTTEDDGLVTELSLWFPYGALSQAYLDQLVDKFNASQETYYIEIQNMGSVVAVRQKLDSTLNPADYPDIICDQFPGETFQLYADLANKIGQGCNSSHIKRVCMLNAQSPIKKYAYKGYICYYVQ